MAAELLGQFEQGLARAMRLEQPCIVFVQGWYALA